MWPMSLRDGLPYDGPMRAPESDPNPEPGERPPSSAPESEISAPQSQSSVPQPAASASRPGRHLSRAPSERYRPAAGPGAPTTDSGQGTGTRPSRALARAVSAAIGVAGIGAAMLTIILGALASTGGTFAITGFASVAIGLLISTAAVPQYRATAAPLRRDQAVRMASAIGVGMIIAAGAGVWVLARTEGGVMDPLNYLWTTFGFGLPAQALVALVGAAWGAASGPIRWRS